MELIFFPLGSILGVLLGFLLKKLQIGSDRRHWVVMGVVAALLLVSALYQKNIYDTKFQRAMETTGWYSVKTGADQYDLYREVGFSFLLGVFGAMIVVLKKPEQTSKWNFTIPVLLIGANAVLFGMPGMVYLMPIMIMSTVLSGFWPGLTSQEFDDLFMGDHIWPMSIVAGFLVPICFLFLRNLLFAPQVKVFSGLSEISKTFIAWGLAFLLTSMYFLTLA